MGGKRVMGVLASDLRLDRTTGKRGVIVDSETTVTRLTRLAYVAVRDAFKASVKGLKLVPAGHSLLETCFDASGMTEVNVLTMELHLAGGATVSLQPENCLVLVDVNGTVCFAFVPTDSTTR